MTLQQKCIVTFENDMGHYMPDYKWIPEIKDKSKRLNLQGQIYNEIWNSIKK